VKRTRYQVAQRWRLPLGYVTATLEEFEQRGLAQRVSAGGGWWELAPEGERELDAAGLLYVHDQVEELVLALYGVTKPPADLWERVDEMHRRADDHDRHRLRRGEAIWFDRDQRKAAA
jgi:hypothetical protein